MGSDEVETRRSAGSTPPPATSTQRYVLREQLGEGAMGVVWAARDTMLDRDVALKLMHDRFLGAEHQALLAREARTMARLSHPNIVAVFDAGEQGGRTFVAMELVRGEPLSKWLATPRSWQAVLAVFRAIGDGLAAAHAAGILHRDIKPSNILIGDDGRPRIADFGVAHASKTGALDPDTPLTATTSGMIGSPAYMSLERICGEPAEERGDQFGYCVAFYEALHGSRPFEAATIGGMLAAIARGAPAPLREVPDWLHAVVARGLAANPRDRFAAMPALLAALRGPAANRRRTLVLAAAAVAVAGALAVVAWRLGSTTIATPDAAVVATAPDAAASAPISHAQIDAIDAIDAAAEVVAHVDATVADAAPVVVVRKPPPPAGPTPAEIAALDDATASAKFKELLAKQKAAFAARDFKTALALAEAAIPYARGGSGPRVLAATSSCAAGDEKRARMHLGKIAKGDGNSRIAIVKVCRFRGIELDDMLSHDEAIKAR